MVRKALASLHHAMEGTDVIVDEGGTGRSSIYSRARVVTHARAYLDRFVPLAAMPTSTPMRWRMARRFQRAWKCPRLGAFEIPWPAGLVEVGDQPAA